jgi:hypothetical protein
LTETGNRLQAFQEADGLTHPVEVSAESPLFVDNRAPAVYKSIPGVSLSVTPLPGCAGDLVNGLTTSNSNLTCGVRVDWSVAPEIIARLYKAAHYFQVESSELREILGFAGCP